MAKRKSRARPAAKTIPASLLRLRIAHSMTGSEFARHVGIGQSHMWEYEHGTQLPTLRTLQRIADACGQPLIVSFGP